MQLWLPLSEHVMDPVHLSLLVSRVTVVAVDDHEPPVKDALPVQSEVANVVDTEPLASKVHFSVIVDPSLAFVVMSHVPTIGSRSLR